MGCVPDTTRKRTTVPAGQIQGVASVDMNSKIKKYPSGVDRNITSIEMDYDKQNDRVEEVEKQTKSNKRIVIS